MATASDKWLAFGITVLAGFAAFIGAFSIFCVKKSQLQQITPVALSFAAGVIIHLSFLHLLSHTIENFQAIIINESDAINTSLSHLYTLLCVIGGIILMIIFQKIGDKFGDTHDDDFNLIKQKQDEYGSTELIIIENETDRKEELLHDTDCNNNNNKNVENINMKQLSYNIAIALVLHHFPEGIATYVSLIYEFEFGILVALALSLHDIPCGISIGVTVYCSTKSYIQPFLLCFIAALAYPLGAAVGYIILQNNKDSKLLNAILFGAVSGILIYIVLIQIYPSAIIAINISKNKKIKLYSYIALFAGLFIMELSVILMAATNFEA